MGYDKIYWENASNKEKKRDGKGESEVTKMRERENNCTIINTFRLLVIR